MKWYKDTKEAEVDVLPEDLERWRQVSDQLAVAAQCLKTYPYLEVQASVSALAEEQRRILNRADRCVSP